MRQSRRSSCGANEMGWSSDRERTTPSRLLDAFALVEGLPARRADDPELQEAVRAARVAVARVLLVLNRMEVPSEEPGKELQASWIATRRSPCWPSAATLASS